MTDTEHLILSILSRGGPTEAKIFWQVLGVTARKETDEWLDYMVKKNYIKRISSQNHALVQYSLLPAGEDALDQKEKVLAEAEQRANDNRRDKARIAADKRKEHSFQFFLATVPTIIITAAALILERLIFH